MLEGAKETILGDKKGAKKQYRYGNLHIREYNDKFTVHLDKIDPRKNPLGHLLIDAPEVLIGLAGAAISGLAIGTYIYKLKKDSLLKKPQSIISGLAVSLAAGYVSYVISKKLKE
tara:strand:+ start:1731 stop:2075 length:345 start_codon:yes stop_codon:yes gene_type:complete